MYTKTEGHHCWWLNKNGKALAYFDNESDVDEIVSLSKVKVGIEKPKPECDHKWVPAWVHNDCSRCGAVKFGVSKQDRVDYGVAAGKIFPSMSVAKFYQAHGRYPD